jgi:3-hydroxyacyl-CoA dehydrogenase
MTTERRVAVIGAGIMGAGIAQSLAQAGYPVFCQDIDDAQLKEAEELCQTGRYGFERGVERGKITREQADRAKELLRFTTDLGEAVESADVVIESVPEDLGLKVKVFRQVDESAPAGAVIASNTSGSPLVAMAAATNRPDKVIGWHWASPPPVRPFAEIAVTPLTSEETIATITEMATACGKNPVVVKENPRTWGFVANRIIVSMYREALRVVEEGLATQEQIDRLLVDGWAWPNGPFKGGQGASSGWGDNRRREWHKDIKL